MKLKNKNKINNKIPTIPEEQIMTIMHHAHGANRQDLVDRFEFCINKSVLKFYKLILSISRNNCFTLETRPRWESSATAFVVPTGTN